MNEKSAREFHRRNLCVAVSGKSGCGNTTISGLLARSLGVEMINYTFRSLAAERGVSMDEIIAQALADDDLDRLVDRRQVEMATGRACVLASRLAIWIKEDAFFKVYLHADAIVRAERIHRREGGEVDGIVEYTRKRDSVDRQRYLRLYGIDNDDYRFADLVLDAGIQSPAELLQRILSELESRLGMI